MNSPITVYKLTILYLLKSAAEPISNVRISEFMLDRNVTNNYISVQQALFEMEKSDLISVHSDGGHSMVTITEAGGDTLRYFASDLNAGIKEECRHFLLENKYSLHDDTEVTASYDKRTVGGFEVHLSCREGGRPITDIRIVVPTLEIAETMCSKYKEKKNDVYQMLVEMLS